MRRASKNKFFIIAGLAIALPVAIALAIWISSGEASFKQALKKSTPQLFNYVRSFILAYDVDTPGAVEKLDLPIFELRLSQNDIQHFQALQKSIGLTSKREAPIYYVKNNVWRDATLIYEGETMNIKIRSHAKNPSNHRSWSNISYAIKLADGRQINGVKRFNLIVRTHIQPVKQITFDLAERFGVIANREIPVAVSVNGASPVIYYFDHRLTDEYMEVAGKSSFRIFGFSESDSEAGVKSSIFPVEQYDEKRISENLAATLLDLGYPEEARNSLLKRYMDINHSVINNDWRSIDQYFDLDYIASFDAARTISNHYGHGYYIANFFVFIDTSSGKFYPAFTRDNISRKLNSNPDLTIEQQVNRNPGHLLALVSRNDSIRQEKYRKLYEFIKAHGDSAPAEQLALVEKFEGMSLMGRVQKKLRKIGVYDSDILGHNLPIIRSYLEASSPVLNVDAEKRILTVKIDPRSMAALRFKEFNIPGCLPHDEEKVQSVLVSITAVDGMAADGERRKVFLPCMMEGLSIMPALQDALFSTALGDNLERTRRVYQFTFTFPDGFPGKLLTENISYSLENSITGEGVIAETDERIETDIDINSATIVQPSDAIVKFIEDNHLTNVVKGGDGSVVFLGGLHEIASDLILPPGARLVLEAGAELALGENVLVNGTGGLSVRGTEEAPAVVRAINPEAPFGSVGILGDSTTKSDVRRLILSGGNERWLDGAYYSGGLSIHHNYEVTITGSTIKNNHADDGMNIKYSKLVFLKNNLFTNNFADQVDLDYCSGYVTGNTFHKPSSAPDNGDGLDISGSWIIATHNNFDGLGDKGISVGEHSNIFVAKNDFRGNNIGVAAKDLSHAYFMCNSYENNATDISAYQKKDFFGGGKAYEILAECGETPKIHTDNRSRFLSIKSKMNFNAVLNEDATHDPETFLKDLGAEAELDIAEFN